MTSNNTTNNKRILINATQSEELRVAIVDIASQALLDLLVERQSYKTKTGNIYAGKITAIEPSLNACFVNFGSERHGFLPFKEIAPNYFLGTDPAKSDRPSIKDSLKEGQKVMVQVEKEERGNKGAALTTFISLAGSYLVLMPNNPRAGGISRRIEGGERDELREILSNLPISDEMGLIVRTAGVGKATPELQWDLNTLLKQWEAIQKAAMNRNPPFLIHQESDVLIRAIRDHLREDVTEIWADNSTVFERLKAHLEQIRPDFVSRLKLYSNSIPLFNRYQIEHQIETAHEREVRLPSGGSIVIGHTEALVAIDVNSGQATKGKDIEQTAFEINKEAARIIACQLRLRDIGGLVVIDFIDMPSVRHRREVENELRDALKLDKARTQVGSISPRFGLLELSRQRLRHSLGEATRLVCARCDGWGSIRSIESLALSILRMVEEDAIRPGTAQIQVHLPVEIATFVINEKRDLLATIEKNQRIQILIIPNPKLESPHYRIRRLTENELSGSPQSFHPSYRLVDSEEQDLAYKKSVQTASADEKPAVQSLFSTPNGLGHSNRKTSGGLVKRLITSLFGVSPDHKERQTLPDSALSPASPPLDEPTGRSNQHSRRPEGNPARSRHSTLQRRPYAGATSVDRARKAPVTNDPAPAAPIPPATPAAFVPPASTTPRPRRGTRGGQAQRRSHSAPTAAPIVPEIKTEPLAPPNYPQPPLSGTELEVYYQESTAFMNKKPSAIKPNPTSNTRHTLAKKAPSRINAERVDAKQPEQIASSQPVQLSTSIATPTASAIAQPSLATEKGNAPDKAWMPRKIASAPAANLIPAASTHNGADTTQPATPLPVQAPSSNTALEHGNILSAPHGQEKKLLTAKDKDKEGQI